MQNSSTAVYCYWCKNR